MHRRTVIKGALLLGALALLPVVWRSRTARPDPQLPTPPDEGFPLSFPLAFPPSPARRIYLPLLQRGDHGP
jgi:hypothetical protein